MTSPNQTSPDVIERLTRMETKLDLWKEGMTAQITNTNNDINDHEARLRNLENTVASQSAVNRWKATTGLALGLAMISTVLQAFNVFG